MKSKSQLRRQLRERRHARIKKKIQGNADRPRLVVFRSLKNLEGQLVDDVLGITLLGVSTQSVDSSGVKDRTGKVAASYAAGKRLADEATEKGVTDVVFDRGGYPYHGRVKAFAEGAREGGLRF